MGIFPGELPERELIPVRKIKKTDTITRLTIYFIVSFPYMNNRIKINSG